MNYRVQGLGSNDYMNYSLRSLRGGYMGDKIGIMEKKVGGKQGLNSLNRVIKGL